MRFELKSFSYNLLLHSTAGTLFSVGVFSHYLQIDDAIIGVFSSMSKIISSFVYAFAANTWQLYLGPIAEILNGTSFIAMRSIASKLVQSDELVRSKLCPLSHDPFQVSSRREKSTRFLVSAKL